MIGRNPIDSDRNVRLIVMARFVETMVYALNNVFTSLVLSCVCIYIADACTRI